RPRVPLGGLYPKSTRRLEPGMLGQWYLLALSRPGCAGHMRGIRHGDRQCVSADGDFLVGAASVHPVHAEAPLSGRRAAYTSAAALAHTWNRRDARIESTGGRARRHGAAGV